MQKVVVSEFSSSLSLVNLAVGGLGRVALLYTIRLVNLVELAALACAGARWSLASTFASCIVRQRPTCIRLINTSTQCISIPFRPLFVATLFAAAAGRAGAAMPRFDLLLTCLFT